MAIVKITPVELDEYNKASSEVTTANLTTAVDATDGAYYEHKERDDKYIIIAQNVHVSASKNLVIKKGNSIQGGADKTIAIAAGKTVFITLDSGRFKNVSGTDKGRVILTGSSADIQLAVVKLP